MLFSLIIRNIWARRTRSLLVALGIGVSIAVIISIFAIATHFKEELGITSQITKADMVATQRGLSGPLGGSIPETCVDDLELYDGVERATGFLLDDISLSMLTSFNLFGVRPDDRELYLSEQQIIYGRYIQNRGEIGLGRIASDNLDLQVENTLELASGEVFTVACIYETGSVYLDSGGIVSLEEAQEVMGREGKVTMIALYLEEGADKDTLAEQIEAEKRFLKVTPSAFLLGKNVTVDLVNTSAWVLSVIAIVMGCIGVAIAMSMSVSERTREVGIFKAIGWSKFKILRMILGESLLLSLIGFVIGSLLGIVVIWAITSLPAVKDFINPSFSVDSFLIGLVVAVFLASLGGLLPAYIASRLSPVEALRHE